MINRYVNNLKIRGHRK